MSRTDAHRPRWVWVNDHPELTIEVHDHADGVCDLPRVRPLSVDQQYPSGRGTCHVVLDWSVRSCSCALCSGRELKVREKRARRTSERALTRAWARAAGDCDLDRLEGAMLYAEVAAAW